MTRRLRALALLVLSVALLAAPLPARASDPPLGEALTLADGTVLPPLPAEQLRPTVQSEMLIEHTGSADVPQVDEPAPDTTGSTQSVQSLQPLATVETMVAGPGGELPNGLHREVLGFLPYWKLDGTTRAALRYDLMSTIAYFSIGVQPNGYLQRGTAANPTAGWTNWNSSAMSQVINAAHSRGVKVVPTITMMAWDYDFTDMSTLLNSATNRSRLVADVVTIVRNRGADGVNVDFEPVPTSLRSQFTTLVRELKAGLVAAGVGSYVTVDTMAGAATWSTGYDVSALSAAGAADALMVMAYDFHWNGSSRAGGVAPMESIYIFAAGDALRDHLARVPASKLIWGVPYYGRAWNTTGSGLNSTVRSPAQSTAFPYYWTDDGAPAGGKILAQRHGRKWDATGQVPWFVWTSNGGYRQGYYDDPASLTVKYEMVLRHGLAGVGIWSLGMDTGVSDLWNVLRNHFITPKYERVAGVDRFATAAAISASVFGPGVPVAYVAAGTAFPDALAGGVAAGRRGGPMLLVGRDVLPAATANELSRLQPKEIVVLGGASVVSDGVVAALRAYTAGGVVRLAGPDRYGTAAAVSSATFAPGAAVAYIATGAGFADALAGGVAAGRQGGPVLLVSRDHVPGATAQELGRLKPTRIVVLGGADVVSEAVLDALREHTAGTVTRLAGADRYATAVAISKATTGDGVSGTIYVATGDGFADGLAGTPAAIHAGRPLLLLPSGTISSGILDELHRLSPARIVVLGGPRAVSYNVAFQLDVVLE
ncbi:MAG TPA: cell wall-binding repeat-containing protein [Methylomirabilota bacterium]|nr:cell wall-binding repeat-containing protein [Methylomirabilota bacterium]